MKRVLYRLGGLLVIAAVLSACGNNMIKYGSALDRMKKDSAPVVKVDPNAIPDAIPRQDPITRAGNKNPYTVLGRTYHLLPTSQGYREEGVASWYGAKFHGRPTANGELYSLYRMTAAHKTLPIPSYVKVTNLSNQKSVVVRVNDRGPFHGGRIIDLSYAAAVKLGYAENGTTKVVVEAIDVSAPASATTTATVPDNIDSSATDSYFLQVAAFKSVDAANQLKARLVLSLSQPVSVVTAEDIGFYRVRVGPLTNLQLVQTVSDSLVADGLGEPRLLIE
ncbi:septal ring lytic transglycosylase RlpA family protein [bacterium]|nr:septal ring lytic transglycosylase RlpA family protein [bacterium]